MRPQRVEIRLGPRTRWKLEEVASTARLAAAERIGQMEIEDVPEPDKLKRQLSEAHGTGRTT